MDLEKIIETLKHIPIPDLIKHNIITALSKGLGKMITAGMDIPIAHLEGKANKIRAKDNAEINQMNAASDAAAKLFSTDSDLANRALNHLAKAIIDSQVNRENVATNVVHSLNNAEFEQDAQNKIDEDWLTQFWNLASTKSSGDVQEILAKILTKEIVQPKSVSPNTLMLLSVLTSDIGLILNKLSNLSIDDGTYCFVIPPSVHAFVNVPKLEEFQIDTDELYELEAMKLIRSVAASQLTYVSTPNQYYSMDYAGLKAEVNFAGLSTHQILFTRSGRELRNLLKLTENKLFTQKLKDRFKDAFKIVA